MAKAPKSKKHPKDMTTEEAINHVFHPKIVKTLKEHVDRLNQPSMKRG
jgi:hypothetical protein